MADTYSTIRDYLFPAAKPLAAAASAGSPPANTPQPAQSSGIDMQAEAAKAAKRSLPAAAPAAPVKKKKPGTAAVIGGQLMEQ